MSSAVRRRVKGTEQEETSTAGKKKAKKPSKDDYYDDQFEEEAPIKPPVKSICIAVILFLLGTLMLTLGLLMLAGVISPGGGSFRPTPLMVIGSMIIIPGAYNVRTAYYAWKGYQGYSYADIAGFGEGQ